MPRTLPWLADKSAPKVSSKPSSSVSKPRKRDRSPEDLVDSDLNDVATPPTHSRQKRRADRDPSTSPVRPTSSTTAHEVELMRPGAHADDKWLMVEDEFIAVAKTYTRHMHQAEWDRLRKLAKSRGEQTLSALGHGTDGRTEKTKQLQMKEEDEANRRKKQDALGVDMEDDRDDAYWQDPQLAGLMARDNDKGVGRQLAGMVKPKANTRAAAGFMESPHRKRHRDAVNGHDLAESTKASSSKATKVVEVVADDDDDDLDAKPTSTFASRKEDKHRVASTKRDDRSPTLTPGESSRGNNIVKRATSSSNKREADINAKSSTHTVAKIENFDDDPFDDIKSRLVKPTYKKALERQAAEAASQALAVKDRSTSLHRDSGKENRRAATTLTISPSKKATSPGPQGNGESEADAAAKAYLAKRAADRARKEKEQKAKGARGFDDIPTFMA